MAKKQYDYRKIMGLVPGLGDMTSDPMKAVNTATKTTAAPPPTTSATTDLQSVTGLNQNGSYLRKSTLQGNYIPQNPTPKIDTPSLPDVPDAALDYKADVPMADFSTLPGMQEDHDVLNDKEIKRDYGGALLGIGQAGLAAALAGKNSWETIRRREKEVDQALQSNLQDRERVLNQTPEATRRAQAAQLNQGKSLAVQAAANVGAGQASQAGLSGGDTSSAVLSAVKAAAPVMQASQGYDAQLSGNYGQRDAAEANINNQAMQNTMMRGQLADMTHYVDRENQADNTWSNFAANITNAGLNGVNALDNWKTMGDQTNRVSRKLKVNGKEVIVNPDGTYSDVIANTRNIVSEEGRQR